MRTSLDREGIVSIHREPDLFVRWRHRQAETRIAGTPNDHMRLILTRLIGRVTRCFVLPADSERTTSLITLRV